MNNIKEIFEELIFTMRTKGYHRIRFEFRILPKDDEIPIDDLDLNVRPINALKNAGIFTIKDLAEKYNTPKDLEGIPNLGEKSRGEVMGALIYTHIERNINNGRKPYDGITLC